MDRSLLVKYYNACNPDESLEPGDARNVDIDALGPVTHRPRGFSWADRLAASIELSRDPQSILFTGLPGSGKSTELRRFAAHLRKEDGARLFPALVDAEELLDLSAPVDAPDILLAVVLGVERAVLKLEGRSPADALKEGPVRRLLNWLSNTEVRVKEAGVGASGGAGIPFLTDFSVEGTLAIDLKENPSFRAQLRARAAAQLGAYLQQIRLEIKDLDKRVKDQGYRGLVVILDSLEKLRGTSTMWTEVLRSAEEVFTGGAPHLRLPVHTVYTVPPAVALRLNLPELYYMPMIKLRDRRTNLRWQEGYTAAREIIRRRIPDDDLMELLGGEGAEGRVERIIEWSGGYPREIVRLLQSMVSESLYTPMSDALFRRLLGEAGGAVRGPVPDNLHEWLARVAVEHRLPISDSTHQDVDRMLINNIVLRYQNDEYWFDVHPAVLEMPEVQRAIRRLRDRKDDDEQDD